MLDNTDTNRTLPAMASMLQAEVVAEELALTLVFHPDTRRIGQRAVVPKCSATAPWVMGRRSPDFGHGEEHGAAPLLVAVNRVLQTGNSTECVTHIENKNHLPSMRLHAVAVNLRTGVVNHNGIADARGRQGRGR